MGEKLVVDVRSKEEWDEGHIDGALHLPLNILLAGTIPQVPQNTAIYLYCRSGNRSAIATEYLKRQGFTHAHNLGSLESACRFGRIVTNNP